MGARTTPSASALLMLTALCAALAGRDPEPVRQLLESGNIDWLALQVAADRHRLTGYLSALLHAPGWQRFVPEAFLRHARRIYLQQWVRNGQLFREMGRIAGRLEAGGVPCLFFKGPLLAAALYDQLGSRASHDIDLLIPHARDIRRFEPALAPLGYRRRSRLILPLVISQHGLYQLEYCSDTFVVEPHWSLQRHPSLRLDTERIWRQGVTRTTPSGALPALSDEHTLLANALSIPADLQNASLSLRTIFELHLLCRRFPAGYDWAAFWDRRRLERTERLTAVALAAAAGLFGAENLVLPLPISEETRGLADHVRAQVLSPGTSEWRRRRLAFQLFEAPLPLSMLWWSVTLPVRAMAHVEVTSSRLRRG